MTAWFTSDLHLGHRFVAQLRGFSSVDEHDEVLSDAWRKVVRHDDQIWVLGDVAVGGLTHALDLVDSLPGRKHLIAGNHDACHPMHRESHKYQGRYLTVFGSVQAFARRRINGREVLLSHFPYGADHSPEPRYTQYRLRNEGLPLLHGHTHAAQRQSGNQIHVGVDAWGMHPVSLDVITQLLAEMETFGG